jgi:hypothetical protein
VGYLLRADPHTFVYLNRLLPSQPMRLVEDATRLVLR